MGEHSELSEQSYIDKKAAAFAGLILIVAAACSSAEQNDKTTPTNFPDNTPVPTATTPAAPSPEASITPESPVEKNIIHYDESWKIELTSWETNQSTHPGYVNYSIYGNLINTGQSTEIPPVNSEHRLQADTGEGLYPVSLSKMPDSNTNKDLFLNDPIEAGSIVPIYISGTIPDGYPNYQLISHYQDERFSSDSIAQDSNSAPPSEKS